MVHSMQFTVLLPDDTDPSPSRQTPMAAEAYLEYQIKGLSVPARLVPQDWIMDKPYTMPDIYGISDGRFFISNRFRDALEEFAPGQVEFIPMKIDIAAHMKPAESYYFINVLPRCRRIDWKRTPTEPRGNPEDAAWPIMLPTEPAVRGELVFHRGDIGAPEIWKEIDFQAADRTYKAPAGITFMSNKLRDALEARFPGQMDTTEHQEN